MSTFPGESHIAGTAEKGVIAGGADEHVGICITGEGVIARTTREIFIPAEGVITLPRRGAGGEVGANV